MPVGANDAFKAYAFGGGVMKPSKVKGEKAGPNGSFPVGDPKHARLAISGATRSYNAGHISKGTEEKIKARARAKLGK
jgi:hypothetical protein